MTDLGVLVWLFFGYRRSFHALSALRFLPLSIWSLRIQRPFPEVGLDHSPGGTGLHSRRKSALPGALGLRHWFSRVADGVHDVFSSSSSARSNPDLATADLDLDLNLDLGGKNSGSDGLAGFAGAPKFG